jgi:RsiW-degrading membrane proteinase PrsW (M82 family)
MNSIQLIVAGLISIGIPAIFLLIIYALDLYASRTFRLVMVCFAWGAFGGLGLSYVFNTHVAVPMIRNLRLDYVWLYVAFAPIAEEILKSLSLFYVSRQKDFTYFVDGAIYGFAAGIGFSITENFLYVQQNPHMGIPLAIIRGFSTCLMHGTAAGLVGAAVGRFRFQRGSARVLALVGGWASAIVLHAVFNAIAKVNWVPEGLTTPLAVVLGLSGVGLIATFISWGLREEGKWMLETLNRKTNVTAAEARAAQSISTIAELLEPIAEQFPEKAEQVEGLVLKQAQLGIKRKVLERLEEPGLRDRLEEEVAQMQVEMEGLRTEIGPYVMIYVRSVFPEGAQNLWGLLERPALNDSAADLKRWADMLTARQRSPAQRSIFGSIREQQEGAAPGSA